MLSESVVPTLKCCMKGKHMSHIKIRWKCWVRHLLGISKNQNTEAPKGQSMENLKHVPPQGFPSGFSILFLVVFMCGTGKLLVVR